jgi:hypothetical protein
VQATGAGGRAYLFRLDRYQVTDLFSLTMRGEEKTPSATAAALIVLADSESLLNGIDRPDHLS